MKVMQFGYDEPTKKGPAFEATYGGACSHYECMTESFEEGDMIRADGEGGWECAEHKENEDARGAG
jgi:hypothetical protein